jgi:hypothetical protein
MILYLAYADVATQSRRTGGIGSQTTRLWLTTRIVALLLICKSNGIQSTSDKVKPSKNIYQNTAIIYTMSQRSVRTGKPNDSNIGKYQTTVLRPRCKNVRSPKLSDSPTSSRGRQIFTEFEDLTTSFCAPPASSLSY